MECLYDNTYRRKLSVCEESRSGLVPYGAPRRYCGDVLAGYTAGRTDAFNDDCRARGCCSQKLNSGMGRLHNPDPNLRSITNFHTKNNPGGGGLEIILQGEAWNS